MEFNRSNMNCSSLTKRYSGLGLSLALLGTTVKAEADGAVYSMDNAATANHVLVFQRAENGQLISGGTVATGGTGTGAGLSSQGSVVVRQDGRWLFGWGFGSDEI